MHLQRHLAASGEGALDDRVRAAGALGRQVALDRHRRPQLPIDKLMNLIAEAGDIELVVGLSQVNAADIAVRELAQRRRRCRPSSR